MTNSSIFIPSDLNLNDGAASKIGQFEQFHFDNLVKIAQLLVTE